MLFAQYALDDLRYSAVILCASIAFVSMYAVAAPDGVCPLDNYGDVHPLQINVPFNVASASLGVLVFLAAVKLSMR